MQIERSPYYDPSFVFEEVEKRIKQLTEGARIDYLTFVPDGEPTLDLNLGKDIDLLKPMKIPIAVITNASLIWRRDVRDDLKKADWVSLKVDSVHENAWEKIDRPHGSLKLPDILNGMLQFAEEFQGTLATETMLVKD